MHERERERLESLQGCVSGTAPLPAASLLLYTCVLYCTVGGNAPGKLLVISVQLGVPLPHSLPARARRGTSAVPRLRIIRYFAKRLVGLGVWSCYSIGHGAGNFEASPMFWECDISPLCSPCRCWAPSWHIPVRSELHGSESHDFFSCYRPGSGTGMDGLLGICGFPGAVSRNIRISDEPSFRPVCLCFPRSSHSNL